MSVKKGFTLAEVLITLGIIGVVAALTLPTLIQNYQKKQFVTGFKKDYSMVLNALSMAKVEHGDMKNWQCTSVEGSEQTILECFFNTYLKPYLKISKDCFPSSDECWVPTTYLSGGKSTDDILSNNNLIKHLSFKLDNGHSVYFWVDSGLNSLEVFFDVNGSSPPNMLGKDVLWLSISIKNGGAINTDLLEDGGKVTRELLMSSTINGCTKDRVRLAGKYCGLLIVMDGWEISDDYPW